MTYHYKDFTSNYNVELKFQHIYYCYSHNFQGLHLANNHILRFKNFVIIYVINRSF